MRARSSAAAAVPRLLLLGSLTLATTGCDGVQSMLDPAGTSARLIANLWWFLLAVSTLVFITVAGFLAFALYRGSRRRDRDRARDDERSTRAVTGSVVATLVLLVAIFLAGQYTGWRKGTLPGDAALVIEVTGHQWWWEVTYVDTIPALNVRTANEIHLPVGVPVLIKLQSRDVIHSFWVPQLAGKMDLIPGRTNTTWLRAEREGLFRGQCAEFCGMQHAKMALVLVAEPPERFQAWLEAQREPAAEPTEPLALAGRDAFLRAPCALCHAIRGTDAGATAGPDLTHVASRRTLAAGVLPNRRGYLAGWIVDPQHVKPGSHMPAMKLEAAELHALLAYLGGLR